MTSATTDTTNADDSGRVLDWSHATVSIPADGLRAEREATAQERRSVAEALDILGVERLEASYRITATTRGRFRLAGTFEARVVQACVVTLDPVIEDLSEPFEAEFWPLAAITAAEAGGSGSHAGASGDRAALADDPPEPIEHERLDVGRILYETLAVSLDPYPRAPDAELDRAEAGGETALHPFAALAKLKKLED